MRLLVILALIPAAILPGSGRQSASLPTLPEGDRGIAAGFPLDRDIASHPAVLLHDDFEKGTLREKWSNVFHEAHIRIAHEPANVFAGRKTLEFTVPNQDAELSNALVKQLGTGHDTVFFRYYSRFDKGFDQVGSSHNGGFLAAIAPGLPYATPGIKADGRNKFVASLENWRGEAATPSPGELNVYCYHPEQRSPWGDHFFPSGRVMPYTYLPGNFGPNFVKRPDIIQDLGRWHCYELMLKANSPDTRDGRIACWLDGKLIADFPNLRLRDDQDLKINHAAIDLHIGSNRVRENKKWYDNIVIATSYIGPRSQK